MEIIKSDPPKEKKRVRAIVRVRPFLNFEKETINNFNRCVLINTNDNIVELKKTGETLQYNFDSCFDTETTQLELFSKEIEPLLPPLLKGINTTIFCYGMTGAGKTHTMQGTENDPGIILRSVSKIFDMILDKTFPFKIYMSYFELYNNNIYDLINLNAQPLPIREDNQKNIFIQNLKLVPLNTIGEFQKIYTIACKNRKVGSTMLNSQSSRSHAILRITVECIKSVNSKLVGKLHLIDLAGSEDNRLTNNSGVRMVESTKINSSLFALGKVVEALNKGQSRIPYRENKLTRLLQDSLGGNAQGLVIANVSPSLKDYVNSKHALNFASKSRLVVNTPTVQIDQPPEQPSKVFRLGEGVTKTVTQTSITQNQALRQSRALMPTTTSNEINNIMTLVDKLVEEKLKKEKDKIKAENARDIDTKLTEKLKTIQSKIDHLVIEETDPDEDDIEFDKKQILSPKTKLNKAKKWIAEAHKLKEIDFEKSYHCYHQAAEFFPENAKLQQKLKLMKLKLDKHNNEDNSETENEVESSSSIEVPVQKTSLINLKKKVSPSSSSEENKENTDDLMIIGKNDVSPPPKITKVSLDRQAQKKSIVPQKKFTKQKHYSSSSSSSDSSSPDDSSSSSSANRSHTKMKLSTDSKKALEERILELLNQASEEKLINSLSTVGQKRAESIIKARKDYGPFKKLNDFKEIKGMNWVLSLPEKNEDLL